MPKLKCFLSYRRQDPVVLGTVGRIYDRLVRHYREGNVFMDVDGIPPGQDFRQVLSDWVTGSDVVLAMIGPQWTEILTEKKDQAADFVRFEIETALQNGIPVVPVLIGGARMPEEAELSGSIAQLAYLNAVTVDSGKDFHSHVDRLIGDLDRHYGKVGGLVIHDVVAPMVGHAYRMPQPEAENYVEVGQKVEAGDTVCLIEAMKVFNEIKAGRAGQVLEITFENGQAVQEGHVLVQIVEPD